VPCYYPMIAIEAVSPVTGKKKVKITGKTAHKATIAGVEDYRAKGHILLPCGRCIGCRLERSRQWAVRCVHEAQLHEKNCFLTLTYRNEDLPHDGSIKKRDLQLFFKRLRKRCGSDKVRYFACGEYGSKTFRPHYHAIIFGIDFPDKKLLYYDKENDVVHLRGTFYKKIFRRPKYNHTIFTSKTLEKIWPYGFSTVGSLTFESAAYTARYQLKKIYGDMAEDHYKGRTPEFALMSRRPGIGHDWLKKFNNDVYPKDFFTLNGRKMSPPRYYDKILEKENPDLYMKLKDKRKEEQDKSEITSKRLKAMEKHKKIATKSLKRSV
jgi:hypothetical protein